MSLTALRWASAAGALACLAPAPVAASSLRATGSSNAVAHRVDGQKSEVLTPGPGSLTITVGASASDAVVNDQPPFESWEMEALADASGTARYGSLSGRAHAEASSLPANNFALARGEVQVHPGYTDAAQVLSDTLASDTPVTLTFRMTLDATAMHFVDRIDLQGPSGSGASHELEVRDLDALTQPPARGTLVVDSVSGNNQTVRTVQFDTAIGHRIEIIADLNVAARIAVDYGTYEFTQGTADVFAEQTAELFYEPSGDVRLETDSGHDYAAPEPGRAILLALSAATLLLRRGRHPRGAGAAAG